MCIYVGGNHREHILYFHGLINVSKTSCNLWEKKLQQSTFVNEILNRKIE